MSKKWEDLTLLPTEDKELYSAIYDKFFWDLVDFIDNRIHDIFESQDMVSHIIDQVWSAKTVFKSKKHVENYLYKAARNAIINYLRKKRQIISASDYEEHEYLSTGVSYSPEHSLETKLLKENLEQILLHLPEQIRKVVELKRTSLLTVEQIATHLKITSNTVYKHLAKAKELVIEALNQQGWGPLIILILWQHKIF